MTERLRVDALAAVRGLAARPATACFAVITLAAAVGLNLAMLGLIDRAILSPPAHLVEPGRVFALSFATPDDESGTARMTTLSYPAFEAVRRTVIAADSVAAWQRSGMSAVVNGEQISLDVMMISPDYFAVVRTAPRLGRGIVVDDGAGAPAAVLSHRFWNAAFGGDPAAIGRTMSIRGTDYTIVGVMPAGFTGHTSASVDAWVPFAAAMQQTPGWSTQRGRNLTHVVMRLKAGETAATAEAQSTSALERRAFLSPVVGTDIGTNERRIAYWLTGVSVLVMIIGLANTATLLLVRGAGRRRDFAIRTALGATRGRLFAQILIEAALLSTASIGAALLLAWWLDGAIRQVLVPDVAEIAGVSRRVLAAAGLAGLLALAIAAAAGAAQIPAYFRTGDLGSTGGGRPRRAAYTTLLIVQTSLSVALLAGAGVFGRSLYNLATQDFGMRMRGVALVEFTPGPGNPRALGQILNDAVDQVRGLPGVQKATVIASLPFGGRHVLPVGVPGRSEMPNVDGQLPFLNPATPELLEILDLRFVEGRRFTSADDHGPPVAIVNETMARTVWPEGALGKCFRVGFDPDFDPFSDSGRPGPPQTTPCREIVGVVRDVRQRSLLPTGNEARLMQYFVPFSQIPPPPAGVGAVGPNVWGLIVRTNVRVERLAAPIRKVVVGGRTDLPFLRVREYTELLDNQIRPWRLGTILLSMFGGLALGVAAMGLYAAFAHAVGERRREMAVRIAIGAKPGGVLRMILREAAALAGVGVVCGSVLALIAGRWLQSMLFQTAPSDPLVLGSAAALMVLVATLATLIPARSAARTNPNELLRSE
jgi:predicted permease